MALIPASEIIEARQFVATQVSPDYTKEEFYNMFQAAVDELVKASTTNGLQNKMTAANSQYNPTQEVMDAMRVVAFEESARQVTNGDA